ncbi:MAG: hypothetical protein ACRDG8_10630 [Actinomycetota bacterium]
MASLEVRFKDGSTKEWELHEASDLNALVRLLKRLTTSKTVTFGVPAERGAPAEFGFVGLRLAEVVSWEVKGLFDAKMGAAMWAELQGLAQEGPGS